MNQPDNRGGNPELNDHLVRELHDPERQRQREGEIWHGIQAAVNEQRAIDHRTARLIAEQLHGPDSPLRHFAATGEVLMDHEDGSDEHTPDLAGELWSLVPVVPDKQPWLEAMSGYVLAREDDPGPVRGWQQLTSDRETDAHHVSTPKIYVISLEDERAGIHHGAWIEAYQDPEELQREIGALLEQSATAEPVAWEIFDFTGFGGVDVVGLIDDTNPEATLDTVSRVALGVAEHGHPFAAYVKLMGTHPDECEQFESRYLGRWHSLTDYARHVADDLGWHEQVQTLPEWLRDYIKLDKEKLADHLLQELAVVDAPDNMVYIFGPG